MADALVGALINCQSIAVARRLLRETVSASDVDLLRRSEPNFMIKYARTADAGCFYLLAREYDFSLTRTYGDLGSPLHQAIQFRNSEVAELLLTFSPEEGGLQCISGITLETPLHVAAKVGDTSLCRRIVQVLPSLLHSKNSMGLTALHIAAVNQQLTTCEALVSLGANLHALNNKRETPWMLAVQTASPVRLLRTLHGGVSGTDGCVSPVYFTPLAFAIQCPDLSDEDTATTVECFIDLGENASVVNARGETLLHLALAHHKPVTHGVIASHVDVTVRGMVKPQAL